MIPLFRLGYHYCAFLHRIFRKETIQAGYETSFVKSTLIRYLLFFLQVFHVLIFVCVLSSLSTVTFSIPTKTCNILQLFSVEILPFISL